MATMSDFDYLRVWFKHVCDTYSVPQELRDDLFLRATMGKEFGGSIGDIQQAFREGKWRPIESEKSTSAKSSVESSTPLPGSGMLSKSSETEWTFTATWPLSSTEDLLAKRNRLKEELESSLNSAVDMVPAALPSYEPPGRAHTVRLYVSRSTKGFKRVISIETHTPTSSSSGSTETFASSTSEPSKT